MFLVSSLSCLRSIHWTQVLSWEWRCSWSSADRRCSNYIWVINNIIAYKGATYIRGFTVDVHLSYFQSSMAVGKIAMRGGRPMYHVWPIIEQLYIQVTLVTCATNHWATLHSGHPGDLCKGLNADMVEKHQSGSLVTGPDCQSCEQVHAFTSVWKTA